jgi:hypothetical protein
MAEAIDGVPANFILNMDEIGHEECGKTARFTIAEDLHFSYLTTGPRASVQKSQKLRMLIIGRFCSFQRTRSNKYSKEAIVEEDAALAEAEHVEEEQETIDLEGYATNCAAMFSRCENERSCEGESGRRLRGASKRRNFFHICFQK